MYDAICAMDGVFIPIQKPRRYGESFYSGHKHRYGMTMLAIVDYDCKFLYVHVGSTGSAADSVLFRTSELKREIDAGHTIFNQDTKILVDSAFLQAPYIIKSTQRIGSGSARTVVEHAFGQFKQKFRLFLTRYYLLMKIEFESYHSYN